MMATKITYNGQQITSTDETPPVSVTYNNQTITTLAAGDTKTLKCNGKVALSDIVVGSKTLRCNGKLMTSDVGVEVEQTGPTLAGRKFRLLNNTNYPAGSSQPTFFNVNLNVKLHNIDDDTYISINPQSVNAINFGYEVAPDGHLTKIQTTAGKKRLSLMSSIQTSWESPETGSFREITTDGVYDHVGNYCAYISTMSLNYFLEVEFISGDDINNSLLISFFENVERWQEITDE